MQIIIKICCLIALLKLSQALPAVTSQLPSTRNNDKRDLTVSYASTDIGLKEGSHVKTLTYIKNVNNRKDKISDPGRKSLKGPLPKDPVDALAKQFEFFGKLPEIPDDIDELFDFVNSKNGDGSDKSETKKKKTEEGEKKSEKPAVKGGEGEKKVEKAKPKKEEGEEKKPEKPEKGGEEGKNADGEGKKAEPKNGGETVDDDIGAIEEKVTKIYGDVELINSDRKGLKLKSQSLSLSQAGNENDKISRYVYTDSYYNNLSNQGSAGDAALAAQYAQPPAFFSSTTVAPYIAPVLRKNYRIAPTSTTAQPRSVARNRNAQTPSQLLAESNIKFTGYSTGYQPQQSFRSSVPRISGRVKRLVTMPLI